MHRVVIALAAIGSLAAPNSASAAVIQLEPTSAWRMDYGTERCSLSQQFGSGDQSATLQIDSYGGVEAFRATVAGKAVAASGGPSEMGYIRLSGDPEAREVRLLKGITSDGDPAISFELVFAPYAEYERVHELEKANAQDPRPERPFPNFDKSVTAVMVAPRSGATLQLDVRSMGAPLVAMRTCVDDLTKSWGIDPEVEKTLSRGPVLKQADVVRLQRDYPKMMLRSGVSAVVPIRIMIDAAGTPTSCVMQVPTVDPEIKSTICGDLRHFQPALDANGRPVASLVTTSVVFIVNG